MIKPHLWPWIEFFSSGGQKSRHLCMVQQQPFILGARPGFSGQGKDAWSSSSLLHKSSERSSLISGPGLNSSPLEAKNPSIFLCVSNNLSKAGSLALQADSLVSQPPGKPIKLQSNLILLHVDIQFSQHHLLKRLLLPPLNSLGILVRNHLTTVVWVHFWPLNSIPLMLFSLS